MNVETTLYRHYDKDNILLYVGITRNLLSRTNNHECKAVWWRQISIIKVEHFSSREEAETAERKIIIHERPIYNTIFSTDPLLPRKTAKWWHDGIRPRRKVTLVYPED